MLQYIARGVEGMLPQKIINRWCNLMPSRVYLDILVITKEIHRLEDT